MLRLISNPIFVPLLAAIFLLERGQAFGFEELDQLEECRIAKVLKRCARPGRSRECLRPDLGIVRHSSPSKVVRVVACSSAISRPARRVLRPRARSPDPR